MVKKINLLLIFMIMFFCTCLNVNAYTAGNGVCEYTSSNGNLISVVIDGDVLETGHGAKIYEGKYSERKELNGTYYTEFNTNFVFDVANFACSDKIYEIKTSSSKRFYDNLPSVAVGQEYTEYLLSNQGKFEVISNGKCVYTNCNLRDYSNNNKISGFDATNPEYYTSLGSASGKIELEVLMNGNFKGYYKNKSYNINISNPNGRTYSQVADQLISNGISACPKYAIYETHFDNELWFGDDLTHLVKKMGALNNPDKNSSTVYCSFNAEETNMDDRLDPDNNSETDTDGSNGMIDIGPGAEFQSCDDLFGNGKTISLLRDVFKAITIVTPILIIVLSIMDFVKAVAASDEKAIKEAQSKLIKRLIIAVLIFFLPTVLNILFNLLGNAFGICGVA